MTVEELELLLSKIENKNTIVLDAYDNVISDVLFVNIKNMSKENVSSKLILSWSGMSKKLEGYHDIY